MIFCAVSLLIKNTLGQRVIKFCVKTPDSMILLSGKELLKQPATEELRKIIYRLTMDRGIINFHGILSVYKLSTL